MRVPTGVREAVLDALAVLLPVSCVNCGAPERPVCAVCAVQLQASVRRWSNAGLPVWAALDNAGAVAAAIRGLKDDGRTELLGTLAPALYAAVCTALAETEALLPASVILVTIPSRRSAFRRRGFHPVAALLARANLRAASLLCLSSESHDDQRMLGRDARARNVAGTLRVRRPLAGRTILIVDDVMTTGATLDEAARVLADAGARVIGAAVLARTPRRNGPERDAGWS